MLFDSSVWIDFLNGVRGRGPDFLQKTIESDRPVFLCPPVYQEILQGIKFDADFEETKDLLLGLNMLILDHYYAAEGAANIFRSVRQKGITIRRPNDCIIAFYAIHFKVPLVHRDKDFDSIAKHTPLKIYAT